jgi:D-sedoheptulose 7-phosphate isomerase
LQAYDYLVQISQESIAVQQTFLRDEGKKIVSVAETLGHCFRRGNKVLLFGNGGSAADAQHMAAELVGRLLIKRRSLPAIALTTDSSNLTAIGNDYGFDFIFSRQIEGLAQKGDVVIAFSTSGKSENIIKGIEAAKTAGCTVVGLTGGTGGKMKDLLDVCICATDGKDSSRIQESHIFAVHSIVDLLDRFFLEVSDKPL